MSGRNCIILEHVPGVGGQLDRLSVRYRNCDLAVRDAELAPDPYDALSSVRFLPCERKPEKLKSGESDDESSSSLALASDGRDDRVVDINFHCRQLSVKHRRHDSAREGAVAAPNGW